MVVIRLKASICETLVIIGQLTIIWIGISERTSLKALQVTLTRLRPKVISDIKFLNDVFFISFLNINNDASYCKGWKTGETAYDGIKWDIKIKKDELDELWFDYDYYGTSDEIEYSITYKYEVIDSLLHFSNTEGQEFIFHPSDKNYSKDFVDTGEIIELQGCSFY